MPPRRRIRIRSASKNKSKPRDRIIMVRLPSNGKTVTLPNGRTFQVRFRRVTRAELPPNANFPRKQYKQRAAPNGKRR